MKSAYLLLAAGVVSCGLLAEGCVSGDPVGGNGWSHGHAAPAARWLQLRLGWIELRIRRVRASALAGSSAAAQGGFIGGGAGGFIGGGLGGAAGAAGSGVNGCPRTVPAIDNFDEDGRGGPPTGGYFNLNCAMGSWYTYGDAAGTVDPADRRCIH